MKFVEVREKDKSRFEQLVNNSAEATCMQMWEWCAFRNTLGSKMYNRVGVVDSSNNYRLCATYAINRFGSLGNILYIPQGPIWDDLSALILFQNEIRKIGEQNNCISIICEPRISVNGKKFRDLLKNGFVFTDRAVQPRVTVQLDLSKKEDELLSLFSKSTRYNIKYAARKGIVLSKYFLPKDIGRIQKFYRLLQTTQARKFFYVQPRKYFEAIWKEFSKNKHAVLYEVKFKEDLLGMILVLYNNVWASCLFSASVRKHSNLKPMYLARWESIQDAKHRGCRVYDFFGATKSIDMQHPFYYTTQYKLGFGRELSEFAGTFEIILNPLKYKLWRLSERCGFFKFYEESFLREFKRKNAASTTRA